MADKKKGQNPEPKKAPEPKPRRTFSIRPHLLSWAVFIPTVVIVFISLVPVVFPALIARATSPFQASVFAPNVVNPFQPGILAAPLVIVNIIVLVIGIAYYRRSKCQDKFRRIASFEITKKQALIGVVIIIVIFAALTLGTLAKEETWVDYSDVKTRVKYWSLSEVSPNEPFVRYILLSASLHLFGNIRIVPFISSAALLLLTYFFTKDITGKRLAGIVSMVLLLQSDIFVSYSTTASYDNFWILLYLFSLYLIQKFWPPSPVPYLLSVLSKALTIAFIPMTIYFVARSNISRRSRIYSLASYGAIIVILAAAAAAYKTGVSGTSFVALDTSQFWQGFGAMAMQMRFDYIVVLFLLPLTVMLFFASRRGILHADSIMFFILVLLIISPILTGFTQQTNQPYRFVSLAVFFAVGVGVLFSNRTRVQAVPSAST